DLGGEQHAIAVDRRAERDALFAHLRVGAERPDLKAAAVGQDRPRPAFEAVQPAEPGDDVEPGPKPEVERVAEDDLDAHRFERLWPDALDAAVGADRHEDRRLDGAVAKRQAAAARQAIAGEDLECKHQRIVVAGALAADAAASSRVSISSVRLRSSTTKRRPTESTKIPVGTPSGRTPLTAFQPPIQTRGAPLGPATRIERIRDDAMTGGAVAMPGDDDLPGKGV